MLQFFQFLFRHRSLLVFLGVEFICFYLIFQNNTYQQASFVNSSNRIVASLLGVSQSIADYFTLAETNETLSEENAELRQRIAQMEQSIFDLNTGEIEDPVLINKFQVQKAEVINNSVRQFNNYLTIDKGSMDGITPGMSVLGSKGIVGQVKSTSRYFSVVYSLLHSNMMVSARVDRTGDLASVQWAGDDPKFVKLLYLPRHVGLRKGDRVVTSGFNAVFPASVDIGKVVDWKEVEDDIFLDVTLELNTDFSSISHVYVIQNTMKQELDSLQNEVR